MPVALHFQHPFAGVLDWSPRVDQLRPNFGVRASGLAIRGGRPEVAPARPLGPYALIPNVIGSWGPFSAEARPNGARTNLPHVGISSEGTTPVILMGHAKGRRRRLLSGGCHAGLTKNPWRAKKRR